jgi:hypothetical protein
MGVFDDVAFQTTVKIKGGLIVVDWLVRQGCRGPSARHADADRDGIVRETAGGADRAVREQIAADLVAAAAHLELRICVEPSFLRFRHLG